jgi:hypothetical protein
MIFHSARRRIIGRLLLVGAISATGAMLLLGGGLSAQGSVSLKRLVGAGDEPTKAEAESRKGEKTTSEDGGTGTGGSQRSDRNTGGSNPPSKKPEDPDRRKECTEEPDDSAGVQYGDFDGKANPTGHRCAAAAKQPAGEAGGEEAEGQGEDAPASRSEAAAFP